MVVNAHSPPPPITPPVFTVVLDPVQAGLARQAKGEDVVIELWLATSPTAKPAVA